MALIGFLIILLKVPWSLLGWNLDIGMASQWLHHPWKQEKIMPSIATRTFAALFAHDDARLPPLAAVAVARIMCRQQCLVSQKTFYYYNARPAN